MASDFKVPEQYYTPEERHAPVSHDYIANRRSSIKRTVSLTEREQNKFSSISPTPSKSPHRSERIWQKKRILSAISKARKSEPGKEKVTVRKSIEAEEKGKSEAKWEEKLEKVKKREWEVMTELARKSAQSQHALSTRLQRLQSSRLSLMRQRGDSNRYRISQVRTHYAQLSAKNDANLEEMRLKQEEKMIKSVKERGVVMKMKSVNIAKKRKICNDLLENGEKDEKLVNFIKKQQEIEKRINSSKETKNQIRAEVQKSKMQKWERFERNRREKQLETDSKMRLIERKTYSDSISRPSFRDDFSRYEEKTRENLDKIRRIQSAKQTEILIRSIQAGRRVEAMKRYKRQQQERHMETLHSSLLERDRTYELVEMIGRSPGCRKVKEALKDWGSEEGLRGVGEV